MVPDECVDTSDLGAVDLSKSFLDFALRGVWVDQEDHGILVFNLFHGFFGGQWFTENGPFVELLDLGGVQGSDVSGIGWLADGVLGSWDEESCFGSNFVGSLGVLTLLVFLGNAAGLADGLGALSRSLGDLLWLGGVSFSSCH